jgi:hypothetical protein
MVIPTFNTFTAQTGCFTPDALPLAQALLLSPHDLSPPQYSDYVAQAPNEEIGLIRFEHAILRRNSKGACLTVFRETVQAICHNASNIGPETDPGGCTAYRTEGGVVWLIQKVGVQEAADGGWWLRLKFIEI